MFLAVRDMLVLSFKTISWFLNFRQHLLNLQFNLHMLQRFRNAELFPDNSFSPLPFLIKFLKGTVWLHYCAHHCPTVSKTSLTLKPIFSIYICSQIPSYFFSLLKSFFAPLLVWKVGIKHRFRLGTFSSFPLKAYKIQFKSIYLTLSNCLLLCFNFFPVGQWPLMKSGFSILIDSSQA